jgi:hypothetical protein
MSPLQKSPKLQLSARALAKLATRWRCQSHAAMDMCAQPRSVATVSESRLVVSSRVLVCAKSVSGVDGVC